MKQAKQDKGNIELRIRRRDGVETITGVKLRDDGTYGSVTLWNSLDVQTELPRETDNTVRLSGRNCLYDLITNEDISKHRLAMMICKSMRDDDIMEMLDEEEVSPRFWQGGR
jgi:hypothetical protein